MTLFNVKHNIFGFYAKNIMVILESHHQNALFFGCELPPWVAV